MLCYYDESQELYTSMFLKIRGEAGRMDVSLVRQRRLGSELRQLRQQAGLTGKDAATVLDVSESLISRIEKGSTGIRPPDLTALLDAYGLNDKARRHGLARLARDAKRRDWFIEYDDVLGEPFRDFLSLESEATSIRYYHPQCVPGLLQIEPYARAVLAGGPDAPTDLARMLSVRMERQSILYGTTPPSLSVIVDECVLRRPLGGRTVLCGQLRHLMDMSQRSNIQIRVLPHNVESGVVLSAGAFVVLSFPETGADAVFLENLVGGAYLSTDDAIQTYGVAFDQLLTVALDPQASVELIATAAEELGYD